jgi:hypothetical protein
MFHRARAEHVHEEVVVGGARRAQVDGGREERPGDEVDGRVAREAEVRGHLVVS